MPENRFSASAAAGELWSGGPTEMLLNPEVQKHFECLGAHSDVATELHQAVKRLGEYELRGGGPDYAAVYCVTNNIVFCGASGMGSTLWRLRPEDVEIAVATGARRTELGPEWVEVKLYEANWPKPDLAHWALRAYDYARTGQ